MVGGFSRLSNHCSSVVFSGGRLEGLSLRAAFSPTRPLADIFHPPDPPIDSQSISRDVPLARARANSESYISLISLLGEWPRLPFTARIERYRCSFQACSFLSRGWVWLIPILPSEAARCA